MTTCKRNIADTAGGLLTGLLVISTVAFGPGLCAAADKINWGNGSQTGQASAAASALAEGQYTLFLNPASGKAMSSSGLSARVTRNGSQITILLADGLALRGTVNGNNVTFTGTTNGAAASASGNRRPTSIAMEFKGTLKPGSASAQGAFRASKDEKSFTGGFSLVQGAPAPDRSKAANQAQENSGVAKYSTGGGGNMGIGGGGNMGIGGGGNMGIGGGGNMGIGGGGNMGTGGGGNMGIGGGGNMGIGGGGNMGIGGGGNMGIGGGGNMGTGGGGNMGIGGGGNMGTGGGGQENSGVAKYSPGFSDGSGPGRGGLGGGNMGIGAGGQRATNGSRSSERSMSGGGGGGGTAERHGGRGMHMNNGGREGVADDSNSNFQQGQHGDNAVYDGPGTNLLYSATDGSDGHPENGKDRNGTEWKDNQVYNGTDSNGTKMRNGKASGGVVQTFNSSSEADTGGSTGGGEVHRTKGNSSGLRTGGVGQDKGGSMNDRGGSDSGGTSGTGYTVHTPLSGTDTPGYVGADAPINPNAITNGSKDPLPERGVMGH